MNPDSETPYPHNQPPRLVQFAQWLAGTFSNAQQVTENPGRYGQIELVFRPLPQGFGDCIGLYGEQAYGYALDRPYRQVVHRLVWQDGLGIEVENYRLPNPQRYVGAGFDPERLRDLDLSTLIFKKDCSMVFALERGETETCFVGRLRNPGRCLVPWQGQETYLVSEAILTEQSWTSRDRGFDLQSREQIWGSEMGALKFIKDQTFASEVHRG
ncbi:MAG: chromophore lyase CpcT/CpeT [Prochlorothrix sp.]|nr:chromophore lyase CpcT/CpeT [Prochlorothrix sp.]